MNQKAFEIDVGTNVPDLVYLSDVSCIIEDLERVQRVTSDATSFIVDNEDH